MLLMEKHLCIDMSCPSFTGITSVSSHVMLVENPFQMAEGLLDQLDRYVHIAEVAEAVGALGLASVQVK